MLDMYLLEIFFFELSLLPGISGFFLSHFICIHIKPCLSPIESDHPPWDQMVTLQSFRSSSQWSKILFQVAPTISKKKSHSHCNIHLGFWYTIFVYHPLWDQMVTLQSTLSDLVHNNQKTSQNSGQKCQKNSQKLDLTQL